MRENRPSGSMRGGSTYLLLYEGWAGNPCRWSDRLRDFILDPGEVSGIIPPCS
jgi:hypothetical protein